MPSEEKAGKIDLTLIQSGFDLEILFSSRLVQIYLEALFEAREASGEAPFGSGNHPKIFRVLRLTNARFIANDPVSAAANLAVDLAYQVDSVSGERIDEGVQVVYLTVRMSGLSSSDISPAQDSLVLMTYMVNFKGDLEDHDKLKDTEILDLLVFLGAAFAKSKPIGLVPGEVHRVEIQALPSTPEHPAAMGVYVNFKFRNSPLPDDFLEFERGDLGKAVNFLPQEYDYALGVSPSVYDKLGAHIRHEYFGRTYTTPGGEMKYSYVWSEGGQEINCKAVTVCPDSRLNMYTDQKTGRTVMETVYTGGLRMNVHTHVYMNEYDVNAEADIKYAVFPTEKDGVLDLTLKLVDTDVDVSFWDSVRSIFMADNGNFMALWIFLPITLIGVPIAGLAKYVAAEIGASLAEEELTGQLKGVTAKAQKKIATVLDYLSGGIPLLEKRMDPFYATFFQALATWKEARFDEKGMRMGGVLDGTQEFVPKEQYSVNDQGEKTEELVICDKTRAADGAIDRLVYRIADYRDIFEVDTFPRLDPVGKPDEFLLPVSEIVNRIQEKRLDVMVQLYPTSVRIKDHHIYAIQFHSGLVLRPQEAGELQYIHRALYVMGYDLVRYRHTLNFYYRAKRDRRETNNLWSLPRDSSLEP